MNMKKTIAGVMSGAMAVSAMAAAVSAQETIKLDYDLKTYTYNKNETDGKVTIVANYEGTLVSDESIDDGYILFGADNAFVRGGDLYNKFGAKLGTVGSCSAMTDFEFTARPYKDLTTDEQGKYQTFKATNDPAVMDGSYYDVCNATESPKTFGLGDGVQAYRMRIGWSEDGVTKNVLGKFDLSNFDLYNLGYSDGFVNKDGVTGSAAASAIGFAPAAGTGWFAFQDATAKMTYKFKNMAENIIKADDNWHQTWAAGGYGVTAVDTITSFIYGVSTKGDKQVTADVFAAGFFTSTQGVKKGMIVHPTVAEKYNVTDKHALLSTPTTVGVGEFTTGSDGQHIWPFRTSLKPVTYDADGTTLKSNDVIAALKTRKKDNNYYTNPVAVINDAIANHDDVTFTFYSFDGKVGTTTAKNWIPWISVGRYYDYDTGASGFWEGATFGQHLYNANTINNVPWYSLTGSNDYTDTYGSYSEAWAYNLFDSALVINSNLTMQLHDTDKFEWGSNSVSFSWFNILDGGKLEDKVTDAKTFLTSMYLYTPVDWYWNNMVVEVIDDDNNNIDAGAGADADDEEIEDEEIEDIEEVDEPEEVEEIAEPEPAVEPAPSPATGNAPVALAVIPVALAAAAVVAKKRS